MSPKLHVTPIGVVRSAHRDPAAVPGEGVDAEIAVDPAYAAALDGVEDATHLIVLGWLDRARRDLLVVRGRDGAGPPRGVFATRCASRPNPISHSVVRLVGRDGLSLRVRDLDLADGTPVLDLKPYVPGQDTAFAARKRRSVRIAAMSEAEALTWLEPDLVRHLGADATSLPARAGLAALIATRLLGREPRDEALRASVNRADAALDAVQGLIGATFSSGRIALDPAEGPLRFRFSAEDRAVVLTASARFERALENVAEGARDAFDVEEGHAR
jgi:tRNA-Thr(GGU) m(6)t(6)A37 methyltransferase TsaA